MSLATSYTDRIRLLVGDTDPDYEYLTNDVYEYLYFTSEQNELNTAIAALENIINYLALNPISEKLGDVSGTGLNIKDLERQLIRLRARKTADSSGVGRVPVLIRSDRKSWDNFTTLFGEDN